MVIPTHESGSVGMAHHTNEVIRSIHPMFALPSVALADGGLSCHGHQHRRRVTSWDAVNPPATRAELRALTGGVYRGGPHGRGSKVPEAPLAGRSASSAVALERAIDRRCWRLPGGIYPPAVGGFSELNSDAPSSISVTSDAFARDSPIPEKYSCHGVNVSPPLAWS